MNIDRQFLFARIFYLTAVITFCFINSSAQTLTSPAAPVTTSQGDNVAPPGASSLTTVVKTTATLAEAPAGRFVRKDAPAGIPKFEAAPVIDGKLDDAAWLNAAIFGDFIQTQPGDNLPPTHPTEYMMGYDSKNLYMAFRVIQDRSTVRATVARRDNVFNDDYVLVYLDTFNDKRQAYVLLFNPLGIQADGTFNEGNGEDYSVDLVFESKGVLTDDGFTIEVAVPFKSLRYEAGASKEWGLHIFRRIKYKNGELDSWMPNNRSINGSLNQAGHITGLEGIETTRQLELNPSMTLSESGRRTRFTFDGNPGGRFVNDGIKAEFGLTAKFSLTPTITLDFAYNPDFAQVEADARISEANLRFPVFFPEKRPFFLERIDIFRTELNVVNTRAIVDPDIAAKLTGRRGKNTFGILYASDNGTAGNLSKDARQALALCLARRTTFVDFCRDERIADKNADIGVVRLKRDIGRENNIGFIGTTYNFVDLHNNTAGFDSRIKLNHKTVTELEVVGTTTRGHFFNPITGNFDHRTGNGIGYRAYLERSDKNLYMNYIASGRSRDYVANVGFTERTDTNYAGAFIQYRTDRHPDRTVIYKQLQNATNWSYDWKGRTQYFITDTKGRIGLPRQSVVGGSLQWGTEEVYENEFGRVRTPADPTAGAFSGPKDFRRANFKAFQVNFETTPNKQLYLSFFLDYTSGIMEYDFGASPRFRRVSAATQIPPELGGLGQDAPLDPGPGNQVLIESTIRYQPTTAFQTQMNYSKRHMVRHDTHLLAFDDNLFSSRSVYQFTRNTFARLRVDYSSLSRRIRPQFVLGWTPNPGTAIYIGYNDDIGYNGFNPFTRFYENRFSGNGRTFFIKASYLFKRSF
ncbi:MAG: carbohydrate binding family 9 domain-containing protein [Pyrinomonadaceae bacterium]